ncbi:MAG: hypothetical protein HUU38_01190 [Anaerolineales bacterium]|nr:hypothetical protein [Anaerolineales bacterium]
MEPADYRAASLKTATHLKAVATSDALRSISHLSLPEIEAVSDLIAQIVPAGNIPAMILTNLAHMPERRVPLAATQRDIDLLFKGVEQMLDRAVYTAFFAGPAAVLWGYQNLLKLAGKNPDSAFPHGVWQFYVEYALREDCARHTNETHGFQTALHQHHLPLSETDQITAWVLAALDLLHQYEALLTNEWRERVSLHLLEETAQQAGLDLSGVSARWQRPYRRGADGANEGYTAYRGRMFTQFLLGATAHLPTSLQKTWQKKIEDAEKRELPAFLQQMNLLAYLEPGDYRETRTAYPLNKAYIGLIRAGHYHLIRVCAPNSDLPAEPFAVRSQVAAILAQPTLPVAQSLLSFANLQRPAYAALRKQLTAPFLRDIDTLRLAPILINTDPRPPTLPLAELRQTERGVGDHPLTLFLTENTTAFDQSHIFFDGAWGAAFAEIMTNEALSWAVYLHTLPPPSPETAHPYTLTFPLTPADRALLPHVLTRPAEVTAETDAVNLHAILDLRRLFKRRSDLLRLTVNDLLILYRAIHNCTYTVPPTLATQLRALSQQRGTQYAALTTLEALETQGNRNPTILIPLDASPHNPRERLYPMTFEVPLGELDLLGLHQRTLNALASYKTAPPGNEADHTARFRLFDTHQRTYLATIAGFGEVLSRAKEIAGQGESASIGTLKLLAHLPQPLQTLLDKIPGRFDLLNDMLKGREVFSNIGAVAPKSTLTRFISAKDDNEKKTLVWGVITDANQTMRVTLRDFRPHVGLLTQAGHANLARYLTQDYLDSYARGLNQFITDLYRITASSRETQG